MRQRAQGRWLIMAIVTILALVGTMLVWGCKGGGGEEASGTSATGSGAATGQEAAGAPAGGGTPGGGRAGGRSRRAGYGRGGGRWGDAGGETAGGGARGGGETAPPAQPVIAPAPTISEEERAKKIRQFAGLFGPVTLAYEKNWDGRVLEWVIFTHKGQSIKMPLSMVLDAPDMKKLEGYFSIYPASGSPGRGTVTYRITATSAVPPPPKQPETKVAPAPSQPATVASTTVPAAGASAGGGRRGGAGFSGGRRGGMMGGRRG